MGGEERASITFTEEANKVTSIKNFSHCGEHLWYPGFAVTCDRCDGPVEWGAEGTIAGSPGRSRFTQWQVMCNGCMADRLYSEIGAWLVVALAASSSEEPGVGTGVAEVPVTTLLDTLLSIGPQGAASDVLVALLGSEAEAPDVKAAVLRKARLHVAGLLGSRQQMKRELSNDEEEPRQLLLTPPKHGAGAEADVDCEEGAGAEGDFREDAHEDPRPQRASRGSTGGAGGRPPRAKRQRM